MIPENISKFIFIYLLLINLAAFIVYGIDKRKAEKNKWRIPEIVLIMLAMLGGSVGALGGMLAFHHKTKKPLFVIGVPVILLLQIVVLAISLYI